MDHLDIILTMIATVVGATWVLGARLGKIEAAIGRLDESHKDLGGRVLRLEQHVAKRRGKP